MKDLLLHLNPGIWHTRNIFFFRKVHIRNYGWRNKKMFFFTFQRWGRWCCSTILTGRSEPGELRRAASGWRCCHGKSHSQQEGQNWNKNNKCMLILKSRCIHVMGGGVLVLRTLPNHKNKLQEDWYHLENTFFLFANLNTTLKSSETSLASTVA